MAINTCRRVSRRGELNLAQVVALELLASATTNVTGHGSAGFITPHNARAQARTGDGNNRTWFGPVEHVFNCHGVRREQRAISKSPYCVCGCACVAFSGQAFNLDVP